MTQEEASLPEKVERLRDVRLRADVVSHLKDAYDGHDLGRVARLVRELDLMLGISSRDWAGRDFDDN